MHLPFIVTFALFATLCTLCCCVEESHFVPKTGIESKYAIRRSDLSTLDTELIMKALMAKLKQSTGEADLLHKSLDKEYSLYGPEMKDKAHLAEMKEEELKYLGKSLPVESEYMLSKDLAKGGHEIKTDIGLAEMDMKAFLAKEGSKILEEEYKKGEEEYKKGAPVEKFLSEEVHLTGDSAKKELSRKMLDEALKSKEIYGLGETYGYEMDKAMQGTKTHGVGAETGIGIDKTLYGLAGDEALKAKESHGLAYDFEMEKAKYGPKEHGLGAEVGIGFDKKLHGIAEEEALKSKAYGSEFGYEMGKKLYGAEAGFGDEMKHSIGHDLSSTYGAEADKAFKIYEDELIKKDKAYGADALFYKDKEILGASVGVLKDEESGKFYGAAADKHLISAKDGIIGAEKSHISFEDPKVKFFELLRRVIHTRKCHLVTMSAGELLSIVNCVSMSKNPLLCEKFAACEKKMPIRVIKALEKCQKETIPGEIKRCTRNAPLYPSPVIPLKIFQCMAINVGELVLLEEKKEMIAFEECAKVLKAESCGRFKWSPVLP